MNRILTLSTLLIGAATVHGQTLQSSMLPTATVHLDWYIVTNPGSSNPSINGQGVTWNFSTATVQAVGPASAGPASATPYAGSYPLADFSLGQGLQGPPLTMQYAYFDVTASGLELLVDGVPLDVNVFSDPQKVLQFPMSYGATFTDTYMDADMTPQTVTWAYSGNGTMITGSGTYTNIVKMSNSFGDMIFWNTTPLFPRLLITDSDIVFFGPQVVGVDERSAVAKPVLYPNPATNELRISGLLGTAEWQVIDALGRVAGSGRFTATDIGMLDITSLDAGSYRVVVNTNDHRWSLPFVKE
jgi:hypothetical protein